MGRVSTFLMRKLLLNEKQTHQVRDNMTEVLVEVVDKEHTNDHRGETPDPEDRQTETAKNLHLAPQDILVLLQLSSMSILLQMLDMVLQVALSLIMELLQVQILSTLLLIRLMLVFNLEGTGQAEEGAEGLGNRELILINRVKHEGYVSRETCLHHADCVQFFSFI